MFAIEEKTTASHRPALWLPALLLSQRIEHVTEGMEADEPLPSEATRRAAISLIAEVPFRLLGAPEVSPFYGEVHVHWERKQKQIILMCFPDRAPLVHHYLHVPGAASQHGIESATGERLVYWLRWLNS
jgi:hypothetical protein